MAAPPPRLKTLEWKLGVTAATDEESNVGRSFVVLNLQVEHSDGSLEAIGVELTPAQFFDFLHVLESAQKQL